VPPVDVPAPVADTVPPVVNISITPPKDNDAPVLDYDYEHHALAVLSGVHDAVKLDVNNINIVEVQESASVIGQIPSFDRVSDSLQVRMWMTILRNDNGSIVHTSMQKILQATRSGGFPDTTKWARIIVYLKQMPYLAGLASVFMFQRVPIQIVYDEAERELYMRLMDAVPEHILDGYTEGSVRTSDGKITASYMPIVTGSVLDRTVQVTTQRKGAPPPIDIPAPDLEAPGDGNSTAIEDPVKSELDKINTKKGLGKPLTFQEEIMYRRLTGRED
jgi:hypothetical protein